MSMNAQELAQGFKSKRENAPNYTRPNYMDKGPQDGSFDPKKIMETGVAAVNNSNDTTDGSLNSPNEVGGSGGGEPAMTAEEVRDKFGLDFNKDHAKGSGSKAGDGFGDASNGAIYTETGEYIGTVQAGGEDGDDYTGYQDMGDAATSIKKKHEKKGFTEFSSFNDVAGVAHWLTMSGEEPEAEAEAKPKLPTQLSHTAAEAEAFTRSYTDFERSGDMTQMISGYNPVSGEYGFKNSAGTTPAAKFQENYKMNLKKYLQPGYTRSGHPDPAVSDSPGSPAPENEVQGADYKGGNQYKQK